MPVEFIGMIATQEASEILPPQGPLIDPDFTARFARAHEDGGFDRILIGYGSRWPDGWQVANHVVRATERLKILLAHRPGFVAPTLTARQAVSFDHLTGGGRLALHIITGGDEADQRRDGDFLSHDERYRRTGEYLHIVRRLLDEPTPFDFEGEFYRVEDASLPVRPATPTGIPIFFGGASDAALDVGARYADVYMLWGEPLAPARERLRADARRGCSRTVARCASASRCGRSWRRPRPRRGRAPRRSPSRPLAQRAALSRRARAARGHLGRLGAPARGGGRGRMSTTSGCGRRSPPSPARPGNSTALVGTPEQVAEALLRVRRPRLRHAADPRLPPAAGRHRLRPRADCRWSAPKSLAATARGSTLSTVPRPGGRP